jgi:hypothetical protein
MNIDRERSPMMKSFSDDTSQRLDRVESTMLER